VLRCRRGLRRAARPGPAPPARASTDDSSPAIVASASRRGVTVAAHIEPYQGRTVESIASDIAYLAGSYGIRTFYIYRAFDFSPADWAENHPLLHPIPDITLYAQTGLAGAAAAARFDGVYTYDILLWGPDSFRRLCKQARKAGLACLPSVGPGYDASRATGDLRVKSRRNGATYDAMWKGAIRAHADGVTITSYNEWHEGTQIEPALTPLPRQLTVSSGGASSPGCSGRK